MINKIYLPLPEERQGGEKRVYYCFEPPNGYMTCVAVSSRTFSG